MNFWCFLVTPDQRAVSADRASDRTSAVSLRNSNNSRQCGFDLRLGRSSRLSTCCSLPACLSHSTLLLKLLRPSLSEKKQPKELVLLHHHLTDPLTGARPPPTDNAYYQPLEINSAPSSAPSALQDLLTHPRPHHLLAMSLKPPSLN